MNLSTLMLSFGLMAPAQDPPLLSAARASFTDAGADRAEMYRHIEVMRQLLRRKLAPATVYHAGQTLQFTDAANNPFAVSDTSPANRAVQNTYNWARPESATAPVDGVYLPGYGVVFTATLPTTVRSIKSTASKPATKPLSEWERAEKELKGEKPEQPPANDAPPSTADIIAKLLAENGQHFTKLRDDERITVVVTFHEGHAGYSSNGMPLGQTHGTMGNPLSRRAEPFAVTTGVGSSATSLAQPPLTQAQDYELLADMHLKQKRYQDALAAYAKAVAKTEGEPQSDDAKRRLAALLLKQAQVLTASEDTDAALSLLKRIATIQASGDPLKPATGPKAEHTKRVPSKLIISAPKRLLTEVGSGRINIDEFRKGLQIEDLTHEGK